MIDIIYYSNKHIRVTLS